MFAGSVKSHTTASYWTVGETVSPAFGGSSGVVPRETAIVSLIAGRTQFLFPRFFRGKGNCGTEGTSHDSQEPHVPHDLFEVREGKNGKFAPVFR